RDYLYIPLGGNRKGARRTYINLMLTMLLGGLWHGASWTFVVWGALHGLYLCAEKWLQTRTASSGRPEPVPAAAQVVTVRAGWTPSLQQLPAAPLFLKALFTFFLVNVTWIFFRAADFTTAWNLLAALFGAGAEGTALLPTLDLIKVALVTVLLLGAHWQLRNRSITELIGTKKWGLVGAAWAIMLILLVLSQKSSDSFIYFQF
ncbi:MAG TPA: MBOAT family O-acyltransferase, partial [Chitinophagaceae bacterium]|nr:MBOAT family O-acyltransferase [Chitinophagaceae bacterium]